MFKLIFIIGLIAISLFAILLLFPMYWTISGSFLKGSTSMKIPPPFLPTAPTIQNYLTIFRQFAFIRWVINTLIVAICGTLMSVSVSLLAGYAFAKLVFPFKNILFWAALMTMMIPFYVIVVPQYLLVRWMGLYDTLPAIFLPGMASAGAMFLVRQYMSTIPSELIDAARVDGASEFGVFWRIITPISKPLIAALLIFGLIGGWRNFFWPLVITSSNKARVLVVAMATIAARPGSLRDIGVAMAGATLVMIPILIIFFSFQKYFIKGITLGGIKG